jgi:hypothetical protein
VLKCSRLTYQVRPGGKARSDEIGILGSGGGPLAAVDVGSDITTYSLDGEGNSVSWHLVPLKERLGSMNATMGPQQPGERDHATARNLSASAALAHSRNPEDIRHGLEPS